MAEMSQPFRRSSDILGIERFFELSSDLLCVVDAQGYFQRLSNSWNQLLGFELKELIGQAFMDLVHPDDRAATLIAMDRQLTGRRIINFTNRYRTRSGDYRYLSWRSTPTEDDGLIFAVARDVTDEVRQQRRLSDDQVRLRAIMDTIPDLVFIKNSTFRYTGCNKPFEEFIGHTEQELIGRDDFQIFPPDVAQFFRSHDIAMFQSGQARRNEEWVTYPDGHRVLLDTLKVPFRDSQGGLLGLLGISRDITDQAQLRGEVQFLGALVERCRDPIYAISPSRGFILTHANDAICELLGLAKPEVIGQPVSRFDPTMSPERREEIWGDIQSSDTPVVVHTDLLRSDGQMVPVEISASRANHDGEDFIVGSIRDVTLRREIERRLLEREAFYRASIEATSDGFWLVAADGRILDVNSAYAHQSGYSIEELRTMRVPDLEAIETPGETWNRIELIRQNKSLTFESQHRRKDGSIWDVEVNTVYSDIEGGRMFAFLRDLRRRRRADTLLKTRLHLSEAGRTGDVDRLMTEVLDAAERLTASTIGFFHFVDADQQTLTLQAWSSNTLAHMCSAEGKGLHYPIMEAGVWAECLRQGKPLIYNDYAILPNKRGMPAGHAPVNRMLTVPIAGDQGFTAVIGVGNKAEDYDQDDLDITSELAVIAMDIVNWVRSEQAQRDMARELAQTARHWSVAMDGFQGGIAVIDGDQRLLRANSAFFALTESSQSRLGKRLHCLCERDTSSPDCPLCEFLAKRETAQMVLESDSCGNPSGRPLELRLVPTRDPAGQIDSLVLSLYDLSQSREQERQIQHTIGELTSSNAELERFAQVAAHDLQEPTRRQVLFAQLLKRRLGDNLDEETSSYLDFIIRDALKMRDMVRDLAAYSETFRSAEMVESLDLDEILDDVRWSLASELSATGGEISGGGLGVVRGQRAKLHLLLLNLLSNALKFRRPGIAPAISLGAVSDHGMALLALSDNGVGIPAEYRDNLFSLFRRLTPTDQTGGTGTGLAQCRRIVEDLGGRIWIEGNPQGGTTVKFTLPRPASPPIPPSA
ncbi:PAS domain S-box protein [Paramagnetospirillum marisnigri]|nr:PAS domain S-box protein [Paramagnetospirillum marisnigri]